jgi:hypothetical protein
VPQAPAPAKRPFSCDLAVAREERAIDEERPSFLKKSSKKLLELGAVLSPASRPKDQSFFGSFFSEKEHAF